MNTKRTLTILATLAAFAAISLLPSVALASQSTKNQWRNLAIGGGALAGYGLVTHNGTATALGAAGAGYSLYRYEQDRYYYEHHLRYHRSYHRSPAASTYNRNGREYYHYGGHLYYKNLSTGARHLAN
jgi:hypothetical protein